MSSRSEDDLRVPSQRSDEARRDDDDSHYTDDRLVAGDRTADTEPPRAGTVLMWNNMDATGAPNRDTLHAALPVTKGVKYIVTRWYRERRWEPRNKP